jgi:hypothetical protein
VTRAQFGYVVWGVAGLTIAIPELSAAKDKDALHFTTISEMMGHLEYLWSGTTLLVIAALVFALFSILKVRPPKRAAPAPAGAAGPQPARTPAGRLTRPSAAPPVAPASFDAGAVSLLFLLGALAVAALIAVATFLTYRYWDDDRHFHPAYVLYGLVAFVWIVLPSAIAFFGGNDAPFPTLFRTITNLEEALQGWGWTPGGIAVGQAIAWLVLFVIVWGLVVLLLHITLYPFPDITHILNPGG